MKNTFNNAVDISKMIYRTKIEKNDVVIDATMGNGNDTAFLCQLVGKEGKVYAFDVQKKAIINTREKLKVLDFEERVELIHDGHENVDRYIKEKVNFAIYNLGYLPSADRDITTKSATTIESVKKTLGMLSERGVLLLVIYPGHKSGMEEKLALDSFTEKLNQKQFNVFNVQFTNQVNNPPELICIEKKLLKYKGI